jgi:DNA (cytosine-5)-methyltransferase 1
MRFLSLFSGIEAASAAWLPLGWDCAAVAEIEPFPCAVLAHHYPDVPNLGDITKITESQISELGHIDLVVGGFPCQDLSVAGKRKGMRNDDGSVTRSGLFYQAMRIVRWSRARFVLLENVPGIYSSNGGGDFASVVTEILGVEFSVPRNGWENSGAAASERGLFEWATLDAQFFGVAQRRRRMFALADFGDWASRPPVLFERHSLQGHPAPSREARERIAPTVGTGAPFSRTGNGRVEAEAIVSEWPADVACTLNAAFGSKQGLEDQHALGGAQLFVPSVIYATDGQANAAFSDECALSITSHNEQPYIAHTLSGTGFDAGEGGTGRGTPIVPVSCLTPSLPQRVRVYGTDGVAPTLSSEEGRGHGVPTIAFGWQNSPSQGLSDSTEITPTLDKSKTPAVAFGVGEQPEVAHCLRSGASKADKHESTTYVAAFAQNQRDEVRTMEVAGALAAEPGAKQQTYAHVGMQVRRLTPVECERLQGFPDNYTQIPYRNKPADKCPDGPRYKALGNSMAVPVMAWIGRRIQQVSQITAKESAA